MALCMFEVLHAMSEVEASLVEFLCLNLPSCWFCAPWHGSNHSSEIRRISLFPLLYKFVYPNAVYVHYYTTFCSSRMLLQYSGVFDPPASHFVYPLPVEQDTGSPPATRCFIASLSYPVFLIT